MLLNLGQVQLLILPNLEPYLQLLAPEMILEEQKNELKRHEAWRVYGALLVIHISFFQVVKELPADVLYAKKALISFSSSEDIYTCKLKYK